MILETQRLVLRPIQQEDKNEIFKYRSDAETNKYQGWIPKTIEDVENFISKIATSFNEPETWFQLVVIEKESQKIIGDVGIHFLGDENKQVEIGCTLDKNIQGKGYASEALEFIINSLFTNFEKHRFKTSIDPNNTNSIRLVERLGFRKEAHFVKSLFLNGEWVDDVVYALTEQDWKEKKIKTSLFEFPTLETDRFILRQFVREDVGSVFKGLSDPDVIKYYGVNFSSLEATKEQMSWYKDLEKNKTGLWWAICSKDSGTFYGAGGLNDMDEHKAEVGFWLLPEYWRQGIMSEVLPHICHYAFSELKLHRIEGFVDSENIGCKRGLEKLAFKHEGTMMDYEVKNCRYVNLDIYALIRNTFLK